jgi:hypothetical protein
MDLADSACDRFLEFADTLAGSCEKNLLRMSACRSGDPVLADGCDLNAGTFA